MSAMSYFPGPSPNKYLRHVLLKKNKLFNCFQLVYYKITFY